MIRNSEEDETVEVGDIPGIDDDTNSSTKLENESTISQSPNLPPHHEKTKKLELSPGDFFFGSTLGEGAYARVVHARMKHNPKSETVDFAIKIMEKSHIKKENKV